MRIKAIKHIDTSDSYHGLCMEDWFDLNAGKSIDLKKIPAVLKGYVEKEKKKNGSRS